MYHEKFDENGIHHLKNLLQPITNDTRLLNKILYLQSLYGWGDNVGYDKNTFTHMEKYNALELFGYKNNRPRYDVPDFLAGLHLNISKEYNFDRYASEYKLSSLEKAIRFYRNR